MPWTDLPTNFKNLVWSGLKKFRQYNNPDDTVSFEDVTEYEDTENTQMSAAQLNQMTDAINKMMDGDLFYTEDEVDDLLDDKQDTLTFDDVPTANSNNPVKSGGIKTALDSKSDPVTGTASGSMVTLTDATDAPVSDMVVAIEPVQEGTGDPSPSNVRAISGWDACKVVSTGKNLFTGVLHNGIIQSTGALNPVTNRVTNATATNDNSFPIKAGTYTLSISGLDFCTVMTKDASYNIVDNFANAWSTLPFTFTVSKDSYLYFSARKTDASAEINPNDYSAMVEFGSTATTYESSRGQTVTIDLGGTRYGGLLDVPTGVLTLTQYGFIADGVNYVATGSATASGKKYIGISLTSNNLPSSVNTITTNLDKYYCSHAKFIISASAIYYDSCYIASSGKSIYYYVSENEQDMTMTTFNQKLQTDPIQFVYLLAEPIIIQLTPTEVKTILNLNHIWADTGDILSLDYMTSNATSLVQYIENQDEKNVLTKSAEAGAIVHFYNSADVPLAGLKIGIEPVQDLHGYDTPWTGGAGKNLLNPNIYSTIDKNGITTTVKSDNVITFTGTASAGTYFFLNQSQNATDYTKAVLTLSAGTYTFSVRKANGTKVNFGGSMALYYWLSSDTSTRQQVTASTNTYTSVTLTITETAYVIPSVYITENTVTGFDVYFQLELGSTATDWIPYSNICPITGYSEANVTRTGKNLRGATNTSVTYSSGTLYWTVDSDGYASPVDPDNDSRSWSYANSQWFVHLKAGKYYTFTEVKYSGSTSTSFMVKRPDSTNLVTYTIPTGITTPTVFKREFIITEDMTVGIFSKMWDGLKFRFCISTEQLFAYEPYNGQTVTIDLSGTRYGGILDVLKGELTVTHGIFNFENATQSGLYAGTSHKSVKISTTTLLYDTGKPLTEFIAENYPVINYINSSSRISDPDSKDIGIYIYRSNGVGASYFYAVVGMNDRVSGNLLYPLATPITIQIDPANIRTLANENFIWADTGDILSLDYYTPTGKTTAEAIDAVKTDAVYDTTKTRSMITQSSESAMTATKNYVTGDLLIIGNQLLRAKSNISSGTTITVGTSGNCEIVDLATVISELSARISALE